MLGVVPCKQSSAMCMQCSAVQAVLLGVVQCAGSVVQCAGSVGSVAWCSEVCRQCRLCSVQAKRVVFGVVQAKVAVRCAGKNSDAWCSVVCRPCRQCGPCVCVFYNHLGITKCNLLSDRHNTM